MKGPRYTILPHELLKDSRLQRSHIAVANVLGNHANRTGWARLKQQSMATEAGVRRETVNRAIADLIEWGWVEKVERAGYSHHYRLVMDSKDDPFSDDQKPEKDDGTCEPEITPGCDASDHTPVTPGDHRGVIHRGHNKNVLLNDQTKRSEKISNSDLKAKAAVPTFTVRSSDVSWSEWMHHLDKHSPELVSAAQHWQEIQTHSRWPTPTSPAPRVRRMPRNITGEAA